MIYTLTLLVGFTCIAVLMLFMLEDAFIDRRLRDVAASTSDVGVTQGLPERFQLFQAENAPTEIEQPMHGASIGVVREFRLADGRYLHAIRGTTDRGAEYILAFDVTDQLYVNDLLGQAIPIGLGFAIVLLLLSHALASRFAHHVSNKAQVLLAQLQQDRPDADALRALVRNEAVFEFSELARLNADALTQQLAAIERERETLRFLGHELRTPLQSAKTSLALLDQDSSRKEAWTRLRRAVDRLARASQSVLWLDAGASPTALSGCDATIILTPLLEEMADHLRAKGQHVNHQPSPARWQMPAEVAETVLANLLLNAIQHGDAGTIDIALSDDALRIDNPCSSPRSSPGFGVGLVLVQRLLQRFDWELDQRIENTLMITLARRRRQ